MDIARSTRSAPKILVADDDPCVLRAVAKRCARHVMVVTGRSGDEILGICDDIDAVCIHKGNSFWSDLSKICPEKAEAITQSGMRPVQTEVRKLPRVLLVDDDISVEKMFFRRFENVGAELLYSPHALRGCWQARRTQPTVIVADYCMPNGSAEYTAMYGALVVPHVQQRGRRRLGSRDLY